jgi:hypothetical protein
MLEKYPAERGGNWDLFNGILDEMRRLADQLDTLARADKAHMTEYLDALNPLPGTEPDGRLSSASGLSETLRRRISS